MMRHRKYLVLVIVLLLVAGGILWWQSKQTATNIAVINQERMNDVTTSSPTSQAGAGRYIDYSPSVIGQTTGQKVLFFHAPWCPQCRQLEQSIRDGQIPAGVTIIKVDYDSNQRLRQQYSVTIQTTLVSVDDQGQTIKKYVAYDQPTLSALIDNVL